MCDLWEGFILISQFKADVIVVGCEALNKMLNISSSSSSSSYNKYNSLDRWAASIRSSALYTEMTFKISIYPP